MRSLIYGILSTLRAKGRTVLFTLLILILTLSFTLGIGLWAYSSEMLDKMESQYTSSLLLEYMGEDYPDENVADIHARDAFTALDDQAISAVRGVKLWERKDMALGSLNGYKRMYGTIPYEYYGIFVVSHFTDEGNAFVDQVVYGKKTKVNDYVNVALYGTDPDKRYLVHGFYFDIDGDNKTGKNLPFIVRPFYDGCDTLPYLELTEENENALTEGIFAEYADLYNKANNAVILYASKDVASLDVFLQGTLYLNEGRFPKTGEKNVCVISGTTAERMEIALGDSVDISVYTSDPDNIYNLKETGESRPVKVVGITNAQTDYDGYIWMPAADEPMSDTFYGYELGSVILDNAKAHQAADDIRALLPDGVRAILYDQGYSAAAQPIQAIRTTAATIMASSVCGTLVVLFLFGYLFVGRQRETVQVLVSLGTPGRNIRTWLLSGASVIALFSASAGAIIGQIALNKVIGTALFKARSTYTPDTRYSESVMGVRQEITEIENIPVWCAVFAAAVVFFAAIMFCVCFVRRARRENNPKQGRSTTFVPKGKTSLACRGSARFALLSIRRGGHRSAVVPAAALVLTLLLGILASESQSWEAQMLDFNRNSVIEGQAVSTNGRSATNLVIPLSTLRKLYQSGNLNNIQVALGWKYSGLKIGASSDTVTGSFTTTVYEPFNSQKKSEQFIALNDLNAAAEFYYTGKPEIEWLDGWDESFLSGTEYYPIYESGGYEVYGYPTNGIMSSFGDRQNLVYPVLVGSNFADLYELNLGDEISVYLYVSDSLCFPSHMTVSLKIIGIFSQASRKSNLYVPLSFWCDPLWITGKEDTIEAGETAPQAFNTNEERTKYFYSKAVAGTFKFTLNSPYELDDFRDFLTDEEFSQIGNITWNRTTIMIKDQMYTETVGGLGRYISFSKILFPVLFAAVGLLGFVISWLMINGRRMEFAIMRGLGASGRRVFMSFFMEQGILCMVGCILGVLLLTFVFSGAVKAIWIAAAVFCICYLAGCALSVMVSGRTKLMALLSERE